MLLFWRNSVQLLVTVKNELIITTYTQHLEHIDNRITLTVLSVPTSEIIDINDGIITWMKFYQ